jgi:succinate dehydrogenase / fumarate reductase flavoprotein subunit
MQGLADGYFVIPYTIGDYLAVMPWDKVSTDRPEFKEAEASVHGMVNRLLTIKGQKSPNQIHKELGKIIWDYCGMSRNAEGLKDARQRVRSLQDEFWNNLKVVGTGDELNHTLEKASRVADYLELGELMIVDALNRDESCGGHFREEFQTEDGEALRDDANYAYVAAWEYKGTGKDPELHKEDLVFENVKLTQRSYK